MARKRRAAIKILDKNYAVGDVVKVQIIIIHPMETGFAKDKHSGEAKPRFYVKEIEIFYNNTQVTRFELDVSASQNPKIKFPLKITEAGMLKVRFINSEDEVTEKTTKVKPK